MMSRPTALYLLASLALAACGDDNPSGETAADDTTAASEDPGTTTGEGDDTTGVPTTGSTPTTGATTDDPDTSTTDDPGTTSTTGDTDTDGPPSPYDGEPLPPADDGVWTWVDFPDAKCRDGSPTGIGVRYGSGPGLVFYFEGGGACFNATTCGINPSSFGPGDFNGSDSNIFSTDPNQNPVGDWSFIYIGYCTGDVHAGARPDAILPDVGQPQQFVGYTNVGHYLDRVVPTFLGDVDHVLVSGQSAGGFGAAFNYDRIADAFPGISVSLLDDSGPPLADEFMPPCLQKQWRDAWGLDASIPADCADCFLPDGGGIVNLAAYLGEKHKDQRLGLVSSLADDTIRFFFGFGNNDCNVGFPIPMAADDFAAGLADLRDNHMNAPPGVWGTYYINGNQHTWIGGSYFDTTVSGVALVDWVADLVNGTSSHVAP